MLDQAWEALKSLDWGGDAAPLSALDQEITTSYGDPQARKALEAKFLAALGEATPAGRDFICRRLAQIGTDQSVETLAAHLSAAETSHLCRMALEQIGTPAATQALRNALNEASNVIKVGLMGSLAKLRDRDSVPAMSSALADQDAEVRMAAIWGLGQIGGADAVEALSALTPQAGPESIAVADALLKCADHWLAEGKNTEARNLYRKFATDAQPSHILLAANKGVLATVRR